MRQPLIFSEAPTYTTPFSEDPWPEGDDEDEDDYNPFSKPSSSKHSASSSRTSSSTSHVLPESAFIGSDGKYLVDPYLGKEDVARLCSGYIIKTFHCQETTARSKRRGQPCLSIFIAQLIYLTAAPYNAVLASLILLQRFRAAQLPDATLGLSGHMLWLSAFIIACKEESMQQQPGAVKNAKSAAYWSEMTLYTEREVDEMYRELWDGLGGNVTVFPSYASALEKLRNPIPMIGSSSSFGWSEGPELWADDEDEEGHSLCEGESSNVGCNGEFTAATPARAAATHKVRSFPHSISRPKPKVKAKCNDGAASPASSMRNRAIGSRLVSFFKKRD